MSALTGLARTATQLSPHMKFGTLSVRVFWWRVMDINAKHKGHSQPPESLIGQLLWREFYHAVQFATPNYNRIRGNPASRFIGWSLQTRYDDKGVELPPDEMVKVFEKEEPEAYERFLAWKEGRTGFPWIVSARCGRLWHQRLTGKCFAGCADATVTRGRLDASSRSSLSRLLPNPRSALHFLGAGEHDCPACRRLALTCRCRVPKSLITSWLIKTLR